MSEESQLSKQKRIRGVVSVLVTITVASALFAVYANVRRVEAERKAELIERVKKLELDSCNQRNNDLNQYLQETLYTLEYEKKKNQTK